MECPDAFQHGGVRGAPREHWRRDITLGSENCIGVGTKDQIWGLAFDVGNFDVEKRDGH